MNKTFVLGLSIGVMSLASYAKTPQVDVIVFNADVRTSNPAKPKAQAFAVKEGKFLAVGNNSFIRHMATEHTRVIDAQGRTVIPGLTDAHTHFGSGMEIAQGIDLYGLKDRAEWLRQIAERDKQLPKGQWMTGGRWDISLLSEQNLPTRQELDAIVPDRPVVLLDIDYHTAWLNSKAMQLLGIDRHTVAPEGGEIVKDPHTGELTGIFKETAATQLVRKNPVYLKAVVAGTEALPVLKKLVAHFNQLGVTSVHDMWRSDWSVYPAMLQQKQPLPMRVWFGYMADTSAEKTTTAQFAEYARQRDELNRQFNQKEQQWLQGPQFRYGYLKYFVDGTLFSYTAALNADYADRHDFNSEPISSQARLNDLVSKANAVGFPVAMHAIGDKSVDMALNAIESSPRHRQFANRLEHIEVMSEAAMPRFAQLGVVASMQPDHAISGNYQESRLGEARMPYSYAWQSLLSSGATLVLGSDWPTAVENPMLQLSDAIFREYNGKTRYSENALSLDEALYAYTQAPANVAGWGNETGSISVGKWADFVILQGTLQPPLPKNLKDWRVAETWFAGRQVYAAKPRPR